MNDQIAAFAELTTEFLGAGRVDELVEQLADPDLAEEWDDPAMVAAVGEAYGRSPAGGRLMDVAVLRGVDASMVYPVSGDDFGAAIRSDGDALEVRGLVRGQLRATVALVVGDEVRLAPSDALEVRKIDGLDPAAGLHLVRGRIDAGAAQVLDVDGDTVVSRAARFLSHELLGTAEAALDQAMEHVRSRQQFGVAIGSFQAVRHWLTDAYVYITAARELLAEVPGGAGRDIHLLVLKSSAGTAALTAVVAAQQVCGGMGFTEEFGLHRLVRRAYLLDGLLGGCEDADSRLGWLALGGDIVTDRKVVLS